MKRLVILFLLIFSTGVIGQTVTAPVGKSFIPSTSGQDASGFTLNGFTTTSTLLTSISLVNPPAGTTFSVTPQAGLAAASGFNFVGNKTRLVFTGTMANVNNLLATLKVNTGSVTGAVQLSVAATVNPTGYFYNGVNGHFYRPISTGATYTDARAAALNTTFKGQTGYLVTITSADEDAFIYNNVPQSQIWFALTDEVTEGRWVIDAGPEQGTVIKTSNGQFTGNIQGQYNNWAGGEPNNSGNEDYAVTKWNGTQWNDLPNNFWNPYVIEYGTWTNPDDQTFTDFYSNSVIHSNGDILRTQFNFDFGSNVNETTFSTKMFTFDGTTYTPIGQSYVPLNGLGKVDMTTQIDQTLVNSGKYKAATVGGQVEWAIIDVYSTGFGGHRLYIDARQFDGTGVSPSDVTSIQLFDIYDGPITFAQDAGGWKIFRIVPNISSNILASSYQSYLRLQNGWYGTKAEFSFQQTMGYKQHAISFEPYPNMSSLYDEIVTVSDVFIAFKEVANSGLSLNESGNEFSNGVQFMNADVNSDNVVDFQDTYLMLQHLTGVAPTLNNLSLDTAMKLIPKTVYNTRTAQNWNQTSSYIGSTYPVELTGAVLHNFDIAVSWVGDVNLSHSALPASTQSAKISKSTSKFPTDVYVDTLTELKDGKVTVKLQLLETEQYLTGLQLRLYYDSTKLKYDKIEYTGGSNIINFGSDKGNYLNIGSISTQSGIKLGKNTSYTVYFKPLTPFKNTLGLTSTVGIDAVNSQSNRLNVTIQ